MTYPSGGCLYDTGLQSPYPTLAPTQTGVSSPHASSGNNGSSPAAGGYPAQNEWTDDKHQDVSRITNTQKVTLSVHGTQHSISPGQGSHPSSKPEIGSGSSSAHGGQGSAPATGSSLPQASHSSPVKVSGVPRLGGVLSVLGSTVAFA